MSKRVVVVMPAYNAEKTIEKTFNEIPKDCVDEVILVDDCSADRTSEVARGLGIRTIRHERNTGYGGNQKTCYTEALRIGADIIVMIHADYQYDPTRIPVAVDILRNDEADVAYGSRMLIAGGAKKGGMPLYKRIGNVALTTYQNLMLRTNFTDAATGYIAYKREILETVPFMLNDDGYIFDEQMMAQIAFFDFRMKEFPILTRYTNEASSISFWSAVGYGLGVMKAATMARLQKWKLLNSPLFRRREAATEPATSLRPKESG